MIKFGQLISKRNTIDTPERNVGGFGSYYSKWIFQISAGIDNVKHIFVYLKKSYRNANGSRHAETSPYKMDTYSLDGASLSNCLLECGNGIFYPDTEYDSDNKVRVFNDLMAYAVRKNDYNTGTQLNLANYNSLLIDLF